MAIRIPWNEQETLLLFDTYEKIQKNPDKKSALTTALSINLRRIIDPKEFDVPGKRDIPEITYNP